MITRTIINRKGQTFTVLLDDDDAAIYDAHKWYVNNYGYACRTVYQPRKKTFRLHHAIMGSETLTDHRNRNRLDNRKENLRPATKRENACNAKEYASNKSGFKGVYLHKKTKRWCSQISYKGKVRYLGLYDSPEAAALARDKAAIEHHGEFASLNNPELVLSS